jgi:hypothetical protein
MEDPGPLRDEINNRTEELFAFNQTVGTVLRQQAKDFEQIGAFFSAQANRAYGVATLIVEMAALAANNTGDILAAEFGIFEDDEDEGDDDGGQDDD